MNYIHRICRSLASLTRRAGVLVARRAAMPAATAATRAEPPRWTTLPPGPAPNRAVATSEPRVGVRPQPPREKLRTRAVPARLPRFLLVTGGAGLLGARLRRRAPGLGRRGRSVLFWTGWGAFYAWYLPAVTRAYRR